MRTRSWAATAVVAQLCLCAGLAASQSPLPSDTLRLTVVAARALAVRANPQLRAARLDVAVARGELRQAGVILRANPEADVLAGSAGPELGVAQEVEIAGQRGARRTVARAELARASASVTNEARQTLGDVDRAFYRLVAADRRATLANEILGLNRRMADFSQRQLAAGQISRLESNLAIVEFGRSRARAMGFRRERAEAMSRLLLLLGLDATSVVVPVVDTLLAAAATTDSAAAVAAVAATLAILREADAASDTTAMATDRREVDSVTAVALSRRPDLLAGDATIREAAGQVSLARREAFPSLLMRASSEPPAEGSTDRELRPGLGFTIPAFNLNRGEIQARRAALAQAHLARAGISAAVRSEVARALASYRVAASEKTVLETTVLAPARENRRLLEIAFREGKVGLPVLLLMRNQVMDAELEYWEAWLAEREALADLAEATGELVVGFNPEGTP